MRIANRRRFTFSCIFFIILVTFFVKCVNLIYDRMTNKSSSIVMAVDKNSKEILQVNESNTKRIIVLDAGHGGIDKGTSFGNMDEKDLTLKIVKYADSYLKSKGYTTVLTRNEDKFLPLKQIGDIANAANGDVFVSIHVNSLDDPNFSGITTLYYDVNGYGKDERIKLSNILENEAVKSDGWESKGIKRQNVAILRYSKIPCSLVECGFITNKEDRDRLSKDDVLKRLAENISNGIIRYLNENPSNKHKNEEEQYNKPEENVANIVNGYKKEGITQDKNTEYKIDKSANVEKSSKHKPQSSIKTSKNED